MNSDGRAHRREGDSAQGDAVYRDLQWLLESAASDYLALHSRFPATGLSQLDGYGFPAADNILSVISSPVSGKRHGIDVSAPRVSRDRDGRVIQFISPDGCREVFGYENGELAQIAFNNTVYSTSKGAHSMLERQARQGDSRALQALVLVASGYCAGSTAGRLNEREIESSNSAASALLRLAKGGMRDQVINCAVQIYGRGIPGLGGAENSVDRTLNVIASLYHNKYDLLPGRSKEATPLVQVMISELTKPSNFPRFKSTSEDSTYFPLLRRLATGALDESSAKLSSERLGRLWLKPDDRAQLHADLVDAVRLHGDKFGRASAAIVALATGDRTYDGKGTGAESIRRDLLRKTEDFLAERGKDLRKTIASAPADTPDRGRQIADYLESLNMQLFIEGHRRRSASSSFVVAEAFPRELLTKIPSLSRNAQDTLFAAAPLMYKVARGGDLGRFAGLEDLERLAELSTQILAEKGLGDKERDGEGSERECFMSHLSRVARSILGPGKIAEGIAGNLGTLNRENLSEYCRINRLAYAVQQDTMASRATAKDVSDIASLTQRFGCRSSADDCFTRILGSVADEGTKARVFEYFRLFGWEPQNDKSVRTAIRTYALDRLSKNPADVMFFRDASLLTSLDRPLPLRTLLRHIDGNEEDPKIIGLLDQAIRQRGEEAVRRGLLNLNVWNALHPAARAAIGRSIEDGGKDPFARVGLVDTSGAYRWELTGGKSGDLFCDAKVTTSRVLGLLASEDSKTRLDKFLRYIGQKKGSGLFPEFDLLCSDSFHVNLERTRKHFEAAHERVRDQMRANQLSVDAHVKNLQYWAKVGPGFIDGSDFTTFQNSSLKMFGRFSIDLQDAAKKVAELEQVLSTFRLAGDVKSYSQSVAAGRRDDADKQLIAMGKTYGLLTLQMRFPVAYVDLVGLGANGEVRSSADGGLVERLARAGDRSGYDPALTLLAGNWQTGSRAYYNAQRTEGKLSEIAKQSAIECMKRDERYVALMKDMVGLSPILHRFEILTSIGAQGKRTDNFSAACRTLVRDTEAWLSHISSPEKRRHVGELLAEKNIPMDLEQQLNSIKRLQDDWCQTDGWGKQSGKVASMLDHVRSGEFDGNTWLNWCRNGAPYFLLDTALTAGLMAVSGGIGGLGKIAGSAGGSAVKAATWGSKATSMACSAARLTACMTAADLATRELKHLGGASCQGTEVGEALRARAFGDRYRVNGSGHVELSPTVLQGLSGLGDHALRGFAMNLALLGGGELLAGVLNRRHGVAEGAKALEKLQDQLSRAPGKAQLIGEFCSEMRSLTVMAVTQKSGEQALASLGLGDTAAGLTLAWLITTAGAVRGHLKLRKTLEGLHVEHSGSSRSFAENLRERGFRVVERGGNFFLKNAGLEFRLKEIRNPETSGADTPTGRNRAGRAEGGAASLPARASVAGADGIEPLIHSKVLSPSLEKETNKTGPEICRKAPDKIEAWERALREFATCGWAKLDVDPSQLYIYSQSKERLSELMQARAAEIARERGLGAAESFEAARRESYSGNGELAKSYERFVDNRRMLEIDALSREAQVPREALLKLSDARECLKRETDKLVIELQQKESLSREAALLRTQGEKAGPIARAKLNFEQCSAAVGGQEVATRLLSRLDAYPTESTLDSRSRSVNALCQRLARIAGLPDWEMWFVNMPVATKAGYAPGTGVIYMPHGHSLSAPGLVRMREVLAHETTHFEQDALIIRSLAQRLRDSHIDCKTTEGKNKLGELYLKETGAHLDPRFAARILSHPTFALTRLSPAEMTRAAELARGFKEAPLDAHKLQIHQQDIDRESCRLFRLGAKELGAWIDSTGLQRAEYWFGKESKQWLDTLKAKLENDPSTLASVRGELQKQMDNHVVTLKVESFRRYTNRLTEREARLASGESGSAGADNVEHGSGERAPREAVSSLEKKLIAAKAADSAEYLLKVIADADRRIAELQNPTCRAADRQQVILEQRILKQEAIEQAVRKERSLIGELGPLERQNQDKLTPEQQRRKALLGTELTQLSQCINKELAQRLRELRNSAADVDHVPVFGCSAKGGDNTQSLLYRVLQDAMKAPILNGSSPKQLGFELLLVPKNSALDLAGCDILLVKKNGDCRYIDISQRDKSGTPAQFKREGVISSPPPSKGLQGQAREEFESKRVQEVQKKFSTIVNALKSKGSPLNVLETHIPSLRCPQSESSLSHLQHAARLEQIAKMKDPTHRLQEISHFQREIAHIRQELEMYSSSLRRKAESLGSGDAQVLTELYMHGVPTGHFRTVSERLVKMREFCESQIKAKP